MLNGWEVRVATCLPASLLATLLLAAQAAAGDALALHREAAQQAQQAQQAGQAKRSAGERMGRSAGVALGHSQVGPEPGVAISAPALPQNTNTPLYKLYKQPLLAHLSP